MLLFSREKSVCVCWDDSHILSLPLTHCLHVNNLSKMSKRSKLSISFKMEVIKLSEQRPNATKKSLAEYFKIPETTLKGILKNKDVIQKAYVDCGMHSKKRCRIQKGKFEQMETALLQWFREAQASNIPISCGLLREKAFELAPNFGVENFSASHGWVEKFKNRHGLGVRFISGESPSVEEGAVEEWMNNILDLSKNYKKKDVCNYDESGLFFRMVPDKSFDVDENVMTSKLKSVQEIASEVQDDGSKDSSSDEENDLSGTPPTISRTIEALQTVRHFLQNADVPSSTHEHLNELEKTILNTVKK